MRAFLLALQASSRHRYLHNSEAIDSNHDAKRAALDLLLILGAPLNHAGRNSTGIWGVNRQGCRFSRPAPWMARGGGPPNHWRITGTPSQSEVPSGGARAFCLLLRFSKVSRRQGGTLSGRYLNNGYVPDPTVLTVRPPSRASPLPQVDCGVSGREMSAFRPSSQASQLPHFLDRCASVRTASAIRPSRASPAPTIDHTRFSQLGQRWELVCLRKGHLDLKL